MASIICMNIFLASYSEKFPSESNLSNSSPPSQRLNKWWCTRWLERYCAHPKRFHRVWCRRDGLRILRWWSNLGVVRVVWCFSLLFSLLLAILLYFFSTFPCRPHRKPLCRFTEWERLYFWMKIVVGEDVVSTSFDKRFFVDEKVVFLHLQWWIWY